jgi:hypothetical protein
LSVAASGEEEAVTVTVLVAGTSVGLSETGEGVAVFGVVEVVVGGMTATGSVVAVQPSRDSNEKIISKRCNVIIKSTSV